MIACRGAIRQQRVKQRRAQFVLGWVTVLVLAGLAARLGSFPLGFPQFLLCGVGGAAGSGVPLAATCLPRGRQPEVFM